MKIIVLGAGLVGRPMAEDLAKDNNYQISIADISKTNLDKIKNKKINRIQKDLSDPKNVKTLVKSFDYVINAVPGFMGFKTLKAVIESGKDAVDIAFFPEDSEELNKLAKEKKVTVITDCGVAPGMSNILTGYVHHLLDSTETALTYVGGLPEVREWPFEYKAVFSPVDVIEEYTRPARYIENGKLVVRPALSDPEYIDFPGIGTLEAFNSDGIRSLAKTIKAPNIKEKTMRYPGHIKIMEIFRETGFFRQDYIDVKGTKIRPLDFTAKLLFPKWELKQGEYDFTVMRVIVEGKKGRKNLRYTYDLFDKFDRENNVHSMARTTGYTATMALRMIINGLYKQKGISVPENIGKYPECVEYLLYGLAERNVIYVEKIEEI